ncbi:MULTISPECIES: ABC transporter permease [Pseudothermotoga]|jgi:ABC-type dipeptide/oligopeptide/nickel transport system permease subunit|uniref:Binding-protein-dependent transport systems inner membrane component n=1 Tax=Pseudothermotoga lettingae (strain ATCC BAA-301 / DSM 14385 / NBRC 107922 / TMO) TaxID=416591 RepID=A8F7V6_PSELT|nr:MULTISPECIES: ABC transporter permease [Pseudothermotoga]ABV34240.1 binding-protein-dependent transport systems inner membrane component [Pseudothermotoga lettingae TMO]GLI48816.1 diguanylate cyclase [Pseudothermotoga lettingae TMO]HBJ80329.1 ABC transporter permease [Pseudothermotoga sp.]
MNKTIRRFFKNYLNLISLVVLLAVIIIAFIPEIFSPYDPYSMDYNAILEPPSLKHLFGTDQFGRDIFSRCIFGLQKSVIIAFSSILIASFFGSILGLIAGYYGGFWDLLIMRICDGFFAFPSLILALFIVALFGATLINMIIAVGVVYIPIFARTVRGAALSIRESLFVKASKVIGKSDLKIMIEDVLLNLSSILIVTFTTNLSTAFLTEASLGFLGLSVPPPEPTLGGLVGQGTAFLLSAPWVTLFPGFVIALIVLNLNILGDGLRDLLDPKNK